MHNSKITFYQHFTRRWEFLLISLDFAKFSKISILLNYVNVSILKEKTGYYLFLKITFWWAGRRFGFNHQGDDRTNKELLSESGRLKHVINASVYTHVPHMEIFDYIWLYCIYRILHGYLCIYRCPRRNVLIYIVYNHLARAAGIF